MADTVEYIPIPKGAFRVMSAEDQRQFLDASSNLLVALGSCLHTVASCGVSDREVEASIPACIAGLLKMGGRPPHNIALEIEVDPKGFVADGKAQAKLFIANLIEAGDVLTARGVEMPTSVKRSRDVIAEQGVLLDHLDYQPFLEFVMLGLAKQRQPVAQK